MGSPRSMGTGANAIPIPPNWRERICSNRPAGAPQNLGLVVARRRTSKLQTACEGKEQEEKTNDHIQQLAQSSHWWRRDGSNDLRQGIVCSAGASALLKVHIAGYACEALLDTGASRSFVNPRIVESLQLRARRLEEECYFTIANGEKLRITQIVRDIVMWSDGEKLIGDFLVGPVPYDLVIGLDWLTKHHAAWSFPSNVLRARVDGRWIKLRLSRMTEKTPKTKSKTTTCSKTPAERAYDLLAEQVARMSEEDAKGLIRPQPKRHATHKRRGKKVSIDDILERAKENTSKLSHPAQGLSVILALPANEGPETSEMPQGPWCCALIEKSKTPEEPTEMAETVKEEPREDEESPWPTATLDYTRFEAWKHTSQAREIPHTILEVLVEHREVFPDQLPTGLPPKRPYDHRILLAPGKLPTKSAIYKMTPDQLLAHKQEISRLIAQGWIGPTFSPICAPTIMVDKKAEGTGERKMRMVVNYRELNALTIAPDFPLLTISTILEMLGGANYFSTLDLESGFHQIRMHRQDRWKTAFRSVLGLFEYKVMPFGLKGAPATFQANINTYLQPLLGQGVVAYLDDILIYSKDLQTHAKLLKQVLGILLQHQFYPKLAKCVFAKRELTYLGYTISAEGVKPAAEKIRVIQEWPEELANETQVRQFLGTVNYCRMFMGPDYADVARPLVDLTRKGTPFRWTENHTHAVRQLKQKLTHYTTLQIPDTAKPFNLFTDASGYAVGAVLEQEGKPIGFLSQAMTSTQQKYSIYGQELLALITALDKWSHLLRVSKVNVYTDHQALTYLQRLNNSKPLRGRTARWLDFLAEFPNLTITYLPGPRNQVADALSRTPHLITEDVSSNKAEPTESPVEPLLPLTNAACSGVVARNTRGRLTDYRRLAGIRSGSANETVQGKQDRVSREETQPPPKPLRPENSESREEIPQPESTPQSAGDLQQTQQQSEKHPLNSPQQHHITPKYVLDWPSAYIRCPVFKDPYLTAAAAEGKIVQIDFQHRKYPFRYVRPYLRVCYNGLWLICVPQFPEFMTHLLYTHHDHVTAGHRGQRKTYEALSRRYYWPGMRKYTNAYVESCTQCRASKTTNQKPAGLLQQLMIPSRRWSHVSLDFITDLPRTTTGNDAVLVLVDSLSKMAHFIPTKKAITAAETVVLLADRLVRYHGFPDVLISDRDPRFTSEIWEKLCTHFHIRSQGYLCSF